MSVAGKMTAAGVEEEQNLERQIKKQMGCMAGFLQFFDRHHILTGKRLYESSNRHPSSLVSDSASESEKSAPATPARSRELGNTKQSFLMTAPTREQQKQTTAVVEELPPKSPLPLPLFELKEGNKSSWKYCKETPRLSLDSRATTDAKGGLHPKEMRSTASILTVGNRCDSISSDGGQQHRSPSVVARLMGLELLPDSSDSEREKQPELRRSASESRVSRVLFHSRFIADGSNFYSKKPQPSQLHSSAFGNSMKDNAPLEARYKTDPKDTSMKNAGMVEPRNGLNRGGTRSSSPWKSPQQRKSFFDSGDVFPEPKQTVSIYGEIEKRLRKGGIDEQSKDLETLKQILETLHFKGLLHARKPSEQSLISHRNFVYDESPIVLMKPSKASSPVNRSTGNDYTPSNAINQVGGVRWSYSLSGENSPTVSPRPEREVRRPIRAGRSPSPTNRTGDVATARRSNSSGVPKPLTVETQRRANQSPENRRTSPPVHSPKLTARKTGPDRTNRTPRSKKTTNAETHQKRKITTVVVVEDESSSTSGSSITTSTDTEKSKTEDHKEGKNLLERCDKLLNSIAEMSATDMQPSPVSVLDPSFYKDDSLTPSPVTTKRNIDFKDSSYELEDGIWSPVISPIRTKCEEISEDFEFVYISDILRASHYLPEDSDVFLLLEKEQYIKGKNTSKVSRLQRKLIFDTVNEILDRNGRVPPWKAVSGTIANTSLEKVWSEFQRIRECEHDEAEDLFETICGVLKKDLARDSITGWGDYPMEMSESILDVERMIFKDLIGEMIRDLAAVASRNMLSSPSVMLSKRKLVF